MRYAILVLVLGIALGADPVWALDNPDVFVKTLRECLEVPKTAKAITMREQKTNVGSPLCNYDGYSCWITDHTYRKVATELVVKKRHCEGGECFKEVTTETFASVKLEGGKERDKEKAFVQIQLDLEKFLAQNEIKLCSRVIPTDAAPEELPPSRFSP